MTVTIVYNLNQKKSVTARYSVQKFTERVKTDVRGNHISKFRSVYHTLEGDASRYDYIGRIPVVYPSGRIDINANGELEMKTFNGLVMLEVCNLNPGVEVEMTKKEAAMMPQTFMAVVGSSGTSVKILVRTSLPDGMLPKSREDCELLYAAAYNSAIKLYRPTLTYPINVTPPSILSHMRMPYDTDVYLNINAAPIILEQPKAMPKCDQTLKSKQNALERMSRLMPGGSTYATFNAIFIAAFKTALSECPQWTMGSAPEDIIPCLAEHCCNGGLPEEETIYHLKSIFRTMAEHELRGMVRNIYVACADRSEEALVSKKQTNMLELIDFLDRRYDIRHNIITGVTEYRAKNSVNPFYTVLTPRDLNTIKTEAVLEGIEAPTGDIGTLVGSNYVREFNPIEDYLDGVRGKWDGTTDHIDRLARMVKTNNQHWPMLFKRYFLSMVSHWMGYDSAHANSTAPILVGEQGYRKSTFCKLILPPELHSFYTDSIDFRTKVEAERCLTRFLLVNIDEFDQLSEQQFGFIKHLTQKTETHIRKLFSEEISDGRRYASFIGTSNHDDILRDPTGNRRFICIKVTEPISTEEGINYTQLYAQAIQLINNGERTYLNDADEALIRLGNKDFERETPLEQSLLELYRMPEIGEEEWHKAIDIFRDIKCGASSNPTMLGVILKKMKVEKQRRTDGFYYNIVRKSA